MAKKIIYSLLIIALFFILINVWSIFSMQKSVKQYLNFNFSKSSNEESVKETTKIIIKNYKRINKSVKKILFADFYEDLELILPHFLNERKHYLVLLQNNDELRATGGFIGSYFFIDFSHERLSLNPIEDIYSVAGQQNNYPISPPGHLEYLSEGDGLLIQDANWWPELEVSAQNILSLWQEIATNSNYLDEVQGIDGLITINLDFIEKLLNLIGPIKLPDYDTIISSDNFAQIARESRLDFFAGSREKANFLNHAKTAIEIELASFNNQEKMKLLGFLLENLINKNLQIYSKDDKLENIWKKHDFAGQLIKKIPDSFYFYSVESNVGINKANRLVDREFHFYEYNNQINQIAIQFTNHNQVPIIINTNPELNVANHLAYINYQRIYLSPDLKIKKIQILDGENENKTINFSEQPYFNKLGQEFIELSFLVNVAEQKQLKILIDLDQNFTHSVLEIQKQSGIDSIQTFLYLKGQLKENWIITRDKLK